MPNTQKCFFCSAEECLTTLGQYCLCASCRAETMREAMEFAKRNTVRGTLYHAAFSEMHDRLTEESEHNIEEA